MTETAAFTDLYSAASAPSVDLDDFSFPFIDCGVLLEDGRRFVTHADHRDMRRAGVAVGTSAQADPLGFNIATAWAYLTRVGELEMGWAEFAKLCMFAQPLDKMTVADPTRTGSD